MFLHHTELNLPVLPSYFWNVTSHAIGQKKHVASCRNLVMSQFSRGVFCIFGIFIVVPFNAQEHSDMFENRKHIITFYS